MTAQFDYPVCGASNTLTYYTEAMGTLLIVEVLA